MVSRVSPSEPPEKRRSRSAPVLKGTASRAGAAERGVVSVSTSPASTAGVATVGRSHAPISVTVSARTVVADAVRELMEGSCE
jgi:hypothetical protein